MMTKPPGMASTTSFPPDEIEDESIDDSLEDILQHANEKALESVEAVAADPAPAASETAPRPNDVTQITSRPSVADDVVEESTKVEPVDAVLKAAAANGKDTLALTAQASEQRDR